MSILMVERNHINTKSCAALINFIGTILVEMLVSMKIPNAELISAATFMAIILTQRFYWLKN